MSAGRPRRVLISGATGGLGAAAVEAALARWDPECVFALARRPDRVGHLDDERVRAIACDLTDDASIQAAASAVAEAGGGLEVVVQCTGLLHDELLQPEKRVEQLSRRALHRSFEVNAIGPALLSAALLPHFDDRKRVVVAHVSARVGSISDNRLGGWYSYRASKAALNQLTRTFALEVSRRRRNAIVIGFHPGTVDTALSRPFHARAPVLLNPAQAASHLLDVLESRQPVHHGGFFAWDGSAIDP